jgi:hydroxymethylpyrimidine pyrophosphatase-like HAD family hydrolase
MQVNVACAGSGSNVLVMNQRIVWNSKDKKQVEEAKKQIIGFKNHGYKIVLADGKPMQFFRPYFEEVVVLAERAFTSIMKILTENGDDRLTWNKDNGLEAMDAKKKFEEWMKKGYKAFSIDNNGKKKKEIFEFDVEAEEILMVPPTYKG